jgi:hypothetical protein
MMPEKSPERTLGYPLCSAREIKILRPNDWWFNASAHADVVAGWRHAMI